MDTSLPFSVWLEQRIYQRGLTKRMVAIQLSVSPSTVTLWTNGQTEPAASRIPQLASLLDVSSYEVHLRLGHVSPRPELDKGWEAFIDQVERDGPAFRMMLFQALEDLQQAWFARPRGAQAAFAVSVEEVVSSNRVRSAQGQPEQHLLAFEELIFPDGLTTTVLLRGRFEEDRLCDLVGEMDPLLDDAEALLYANSETQIVPVRDGAFSFAPIPRQDKVIRLLIALRLTP